MIPVWLPENGSVWKALAGLLIVLVARKLVVFMRLREFKGPPGTGFTDFFHGKAFLGGRCHEWYEDVSEKYGPIARIAPNILLTSSAEVWAHVNIKPAYKRSNWYYQALRFEHRRDNVFSQTDNQKHDQTRKKMAAGYSGRDNLALEPSIDSCVETFLKLIRNKYLSTTTGAVLPMDMAKKVQYFTLDVISDVGLGQTFGMLETDSDVNDAAKSSEEGLESLNVLVALGLGRLPQVPWLGRFLAPSVTDKKGFGQMIATCFRYVDERVALDTGAKSDMLASFVRHGLAGDELRTEAVEQVVAGSDTTAGAIRGTLLHVMTNPRVYRRLQQEIDGAVRDGRAPAAETGLITNAQARQLPYLQAVIRESMRMFVPVANIFSRDVPPGGDTVTVDGKAVHIPGGVNIGYSGWAMHHDKAMYGDDAKAFRPERWFNKDPERLAAMTKTNDLIFGHGRWHCLGKPVAQIELNKVIFELFRNFDLALLKPTTPWKAQNVIGLYNISDMWVQIFAREEADCH